ncbi:hypothetical protein [uncultured Mediterranean phage]|nr:hypothetical protein [uncultured Mediterranean phage]
MIDQYMYYAITELVKEGLPVYVALDRVGYNRNYFYKDATVRQKKLLQYEAATHAREPRVGVIGWSSFRELDKLFRNE